MFTIIGGDGKEYGPVTTEQVRAWIAAGRANLETQAKALGSTEWRRLGDYAEFGAATGSVPPPPPIAAAMPGAVAAAPGVDPNVAERWRRFLGALLDGVLESLCWMPTGFAMMRAMAEMMAAGRVNPPEVVQAFFDSLGRSIPYLVALVIVQATLIGLRSQSIGKLACGMRIVRVRDGAPAGFLNAFLLRGVVTRVLRQIPLLGFLYWIVDACFIFGDERRCIHDLIAGTKVVKV